MSSSVCYPSGIFKNYSTLTLWYCFALIIVVVFGLFGNSIVNQTKRRPLWPAALLEYPWFVRPLHLPCKLGSSFCTCCGIGLWSPLQQHSWLDIEYIPIGLLGFWNLLDSFNLCLVRLLALVALVIILAFGLLCDNIVTQAMNTPLGQLAIWNLDDLFNLCLVIFVALICVLVFNLFYIIIGSQILNTLFVLLLFWNIQK